MRWASSITVCHCQAKCQTSKLKKVKKERFFDIITKKYYTFLFYFCDFLLPKMDVLCSFIFAYFGSWWWWWLWQLYIQFALVHFFHLFVLIRGDKPQHLCIEIMVWNDILKMLSEPMLHFNSFAVRFHKFNISYDINMFKVSHPWFNRCCFSPIWLTREKQKNVYHWNS